MIVYAEPTKDSLTRAISEAIQNLGNVYPEKAHERLKGSFPLRKQCIRGRISLKELKLFTKTFPKWRLSLLLKG
jgi:hypothetical protein